MLRCQLFRGGVREKPEELSPLNYWRGNEVLVYLLSIPAGHLASASYRKPVIAYLPPELLPHNKGGQWEVDYPTKIYQRDRE